MIVYPAKHLFEAKLPTLEDHEEEIFYQHPVYDIKVNQLGVLYMDENRYQFYEKPDSSYVRDNITRKGLASKNRIIWECYTGEVCYNPHFLYANGNPLDVRFENLIKSSDLPEAEREKYRSIKRRFIRASVEHLLKIEARAQKMGMTESELHKVLMLPNWLQVARQKYVAPPPKPERVITWGGSKSRTTPEEADEVVKLYKQGLTHYGIIQRMGWKSTSRVKKVLRDRGLKR